MAFLLKSSYTLSRNPAIQIQEAHTAISLHLGLLSNQNFSPCICFVTRDSLVKMGDEIFFQVRKYFSKIYAFFGVENRFLEPIDIDNIAIRAYNSSEDVKSIRIHELDEKNVPKQSICLNLEDWEQLVHLRDVLCLNLTLLRKYSIYGRLVFDRLVNHLATLDSSESDMFQLPMDMIQDHQYLQLNLSHFDVQTCQLLDAEIRAFLCDKIKARANILREMQPVTFTSFYPFV